MLVEIGHATRTQKMSPLAAESIMNPEVGLKEKAAAWLAAQGVSTILLIGICYGVYAKSELIMGRIESGYERNADQLMQVSKQRDETLEKMITQWKDDRKLLIEILRADQVRVQSLQMESSSARQ